MELKEILCRYKETPEEFAAFLNTLSKEDKDKVLKSFTTPLNKMMDHNTYVNK